MKRYSSLALSVLLVSLLPSACRGSDKQSPPAPAQGKEGQASPQATSIPASPANPLAHPLGGVGGSGQERPSLAPLVERVRPAVVGVTIHRRVPAGSGQGDLDDLFRHFFGEPGGPPAPSRRPQIETGLGSGFVIDAGRGLVLTNNHVVEGADEVLVRLVDERELTAKVVGTDPATDVAVIRLKETRGLVAAPLGDSDSLRVGDFVMAIGNPFGLELTVTSGIISAKARVIGAGPYDDFLQTDAAINPGNSGGPLFDLDGNVVGINTAIVASGQGIGFAVPISLVKSLLPQLEKTGKVVRGYLAVTVQDLTPDLAKAMGVSEPSGALVSSVERGGPAAAAGLRAGDVVVALNGDPVKNAAALSRGVAALSPGQKVALKYVRKGTPAETNATLGERPAKPGLGRPGGNGSQEESLGLTLRPVPPEARQQLSIEGGALVAEVQPESRAGRAGLRRGDVIVEANGQEIRTPQDFVTAVRSARDQQVLVRILREGGGLFAVIPGGK
ncbi:MAG TPA: Do family serine endopeptidase [Myxococcales bacterium]|jgi:serine protease Do